MASPGELTVVRAGAGVPMDKEGQALSLLDDSLRQLCGLLRAGSSKEMTAEPQKQTGRAGEGCHSRRSDPGSCSLAWRLWVVFLGWLRGSHKGTTSFISDSERVCLPEFALTVKGLAHSRYLLNE